MLLLFVPLLRGYQDMVLVGRDSENLSVENTSSHDGYVRPDGSFMDWDMSHWLVGLLGVILGSIPLIVRAVLVYRAGSTAIDLTERRELFAESSKIRADLMTEITALRKSLHELSDKNLKYAVENAELKTLLQQLRNENRRLKKIIEQLKEENKKMLVRVQHLEKAIFRQEEQKTQKNPETREAESGDSQNEQKQTSGN